MRLIVDGLFVVASGAVQCSAYFTTRGANYVRPNAVRKTITSGLFVAAPADTGSTNELEDAIIHNDGVASVSVELRLGAADGHLLLKSTLAAGSALQYAAGSGWWVSTLNA